MHKILMTLTALVSLNLMASEVCLDSLNHEFRTRGLGNNISSPSGNLSMINRDRGDILRNLEYMKTRIENRMQAEIGPEKFHPYDWTKWNTAGLVAPSTDAEIQSALEKHNEYKFAADNFKKSLWYRNQMDEIDVQQSILDDELDEIWLENNRVNFNKFKLVETSSGKKAKIFYNDDDIVGASFFDPDNQGRSDIYIFDGNCGKIKNFRSIKKYTQGLSSETFIANKNTCEAVLDPDLRNKAQTYNSQIESYHQVCQLAGGTSEGQFPSWMTTIVLTRKCQCTNLNGGKFLISPFQKSCSKETRPGFNEYEQVQNKIRETLPTKFWWFDYGKQHYNDMFATCQRIVEYMETPDEFNSPCRSCKTGASNSGSSTSFGVQ